MGFKDILKKAGQKARDRKEMLKAADDEMRVGEILHERRKSANLRELERYEKEDFESDVKERLDYMRKKRDNDIRFNHNPLDVPNITNNVEWEVLKERNMFKGNKNMFEGQGSIHKNNPNLHNSGNVLKHDGSMFRNQGGLI